MLLLIPCSLVLEVGLCWKGGVELRPQSTSVILSDPFIHKGKIVVLIPRARRDIQGMLMTAFVGIRAPRGLGVS